MAKEAIASIAIVSVIVSFAINCNATIYVNNALGYWDGSTVSYAYRDSSSNELKTHQLTTTYMSQNLSVDGLFPSNDMVKYINGSFVNLNATGTAFVIDNRLSRYCSIYLVKPITFNAGSRYVFIMRLNEIKTTHADESTLYYRNLENWRIISSDGKTLNVVPVVDGRYYLFDITCTETFTASTLQFAFYGSDVNGIVLTIDVDISLSSFVENDGNEVIDPMNSTIIDKLDDNADKLDNIDNSLNTEYPEITVSPNDVIGNIVNEDEAVIDFGDQINNLFDYLNGSNLTSARLWIMNFVNPFFDLPLFAPFILIASVFLVACFILGR